MYEILDQFFGIERAFSKKDGQMEQSGIFDTMSM